MKLARTLQLPTGMAMTFVCTPARTQDPETLRRSEVIDLFPSREDPPAEDWNDLRRPPRS